MASMSFLFLQILLFVTIANYQVSALKCYACTVNIGDIDQRCVTDPDSVQVGQKIVDCKYEYCTSKRVEYKDPPNKVHSMHRGCDSDPVQMNSIVEDDTYITYYRACRQDLCNSGNGKGGDGGIGFEPETGEENVIFVKGIDQASVNGINHGMIMIAAVVALMMGIVGYKIYRKLQPKSTTKEEGKKTRPKPKKSHQITKPKYH